MRSFHAVLELIIGAVLIGACYIVWKHSITIVPVEPVVDHQEITTSRVYNPQGVIGMLLLAGTGGALWIQGISFLIQRPDRLGNPRTHV